VDEGCGVLGASLLGLRHGDGLRQGSNAVEVPSPTGVVQGCVALYVFNAWMGPAHYQQSGGLGLTRQNCHVECGLQQTQPNLKPLLIISASSLDERLGLSPDNQIPTLLTHNSPESFE